MPTLAFGHLLGTTVVVADFRYAIDDFLTVELQNDAERTVRRRVVGAEVEEHVVLMLAAAFHAPVFRFEARGFFFQLLLGQGQAERIKFSGARRVILAQRVTFPRGRHHDPRQVRVAAEVDAIEVPDFALVPVGVGPDAGDAGHIQITFAQGDLEHDVAVTRQRHQVIEHGEIRIRQATTLSSQALVNTMQVVQHDVGAR